MAAKRKPMGIASNIPETIPANMDNTPSTKSGKQEIQIVAKIIGFGRPRTIPRYMDPLAMADSNGPMGEVLKGVPHCLHHSRSG